MKRIWFLDLNPTLSAEGLMDKHLQPCMLEALEMCSNAYHLVKATVGPPPDNNGVPFKRTDWEDRCAIWTRSNFGNWGWMRMFAIGCYREYLTRFSSDPGYREAILYINNPSNLPNWLGNDNWKQPPLLMDAYKPDYKLSLIANFRKYYATTNRHQLQYTNRKMPRWIVEEYSNQVSELIDAAELQLVDPDKHRPKGLSDDLWKAIKEKATEVVNGRDEL